MSAPRFFVSEPCAVGIEIALDDGDAHHAANVLELKRGEKVVVLDAVGAWHAEVVAVSKGSVRVRIVGAADESTGELPVAVTVLQALVKGSKFDEVVEKTVELGVRRIVPVRCERSYAEAGSAKIERWRRIARAAAQQSRSRILPIVEDPINWAVAAEKSAASMATIVAWEGAPHGSLAQAIQSMKDAKAIAIAVGPEGSFTEVELAVAQSAGCLLVSLGPTILRTETAAAAMLAAIASGCDWW